VKTSFSSVLLAGAATLLLSASGFAQQQLAPYGQPQTPNAGTATSGLYGNGAGSCAIFEDFESYVVATGNAENTGVFSIDDTTITGTGQGPGLVADGVTYRCNGGAGMQWNGPAWFGQVSKNVLGNTSDGAVYFDLDAPATSVSFDLSAFDGFPDNAVMTIRNSGGSVIFTSGSISLPSATPVPFSYSGSDIRFVEIQGSNFSWSPILDNLCVGGGGLTLNVIGACPGPVKIDVTGATPGGSVVVVASLNGPGAFTIPAGNPCAGTVMGLAGPIFRYRKFNADAAGNLTFTVNIPQQLCGRLWLQVIDLSTCGLSNVVNF